MAYPHEAKNARLAGIKHLAYGFSIPPRYDTAELDIPLVRRTILNDSIQQKLLSFHKAKGS
ncbi:MAG: hypothetical protein AB7F86_07915 [Bdellovibrionales bacterium]